MTLLNHLRVNFKYSKRNYPTPIDKNNQQISIKTKTIKDFKLRIKSLPTLLTNQ